MTRTPTGDYFMPIPGSTDSFANVRRFLKMPVTTEHCELCNRELAAGHQHLFEPVHRKLLCACTGCALLFSGRSDLKYKRVPDRIRFLPDFELTDGQWDSLMIPIEIAFFSHNTPAGRVVAIYPSPAGPTESLLSLDSWSGIAQQNPQLESMEADVEALLVNRAGRTGGLTTGQYYIVPIDESYKLVGLIRTHWRGFSGGTKVWDEISRFFAGLRERAVPERVHA